MFDADGVHAETVALHELGWVYITNFHIDRTGNFYVQAQKVEFQKLNSPTTITIARVDDLRSFTRTAVDSAAIKQMIRNDTGMLSISAPFHPRLAWGIAPSGNIVVCNSDDYVIKIYSSDLVLLSENKFECEKPIVSDADKEDYEEAFENEYLELAKNADIPKHKPYFDSMHIDADGYLLFRLDGDDDKLATYDLFTPQGKFVKKVTLPKLAGSPLLTKGAIYNIELYEEESWVVYRYRPL
jgi:hypothetical protein